MSALMRHIIACRNAVLPGGRIRLFIGTQPVGWLAPDTTRALAGLGVPAGPDGITLTPGELAALSRAMAEAGRYRWRDEAFDVRAVPDGPVLAQLDRGALPAFGVRAEGVHLNGLVQRPGGPFMWVARRAANKLLDPGKLDHIVGGGIPAGLSPLETLAKEAAEEAGLPASLVAQARRVAIIGYAMDRPEGLRRDRLYCYDLDLPPDFVPHPRDGEVEAFQLWPLDRVLDTVRTTDEFKFNVNLVLIDLFLRHGMVSLAEAAPLRVALQAPGN